MPILLPVVVSLVAAGMSDASGDVPDESKIPKLARTGYCAEFAVALQCIYNYSLSAFFLKEPNPDYEGEPGGGCDEYGEEEFLIGSYVHVFAMHSVEGYGIDVDGIDLISNMQSRLFTLPGQSVVIMPTTEKDLDDIGMEGLDEMLVVQMMEYIRKQPLKYERLDEADLSFLLGPKGTLPHIGLEKGRTLRDGIARYASPHGSVRYVRYEKGVPLAALQVVTRDGRTATVSTVYVVPARRRLGYASALLERARKDFEHVAFDTHRTAQGQAWIEAVDDR